MNAPAANAFQNTFTRHAEAFSDIHCHTASSSLISNLATQVELLRMEGCVMPITVNHGEPNNAWVCSPLTTYCDYALEELNRNVHPFLGKPLSLICHAFGHVLKQARIDRAVALNNWMLSTNLYPALNEVNLSKLVDSALQRWPGHALWFRSLNVAQNAAWIEALDALGFKLIPSRQVYLFDDLHSQISVHENLKRDMHLLHSTPMQRIDDAEFHEADYAHIAHLYGKLYLEKYSRLNPQYTALFMKRWHDAGLLKFKGFRDSSGMLQAVAGMFRQGNTITAPIVGYNTALPQSLGLYRLLMAGVFEEAISANSTVNLSAGAAYFKRLRGGKPAIEYSAVLVEHLPASTQRAISVLRKLTNSIGIPIMRRFKL